MNKETTVLSHHHILPLKLYLGVGLALLFLTAITVTVSFFHFGPYNLLVAMIIAAIKATLVALFFMHLKYDNKLYLIIFVTSILFLAVFIILTLFDTLRRGDVDEEKVAPINKNAVIYDSLRTSGHEKIMDSLTIKNDTLTQSSDSAK